ncbi:UNVERIFIED_CONTAM: hypothetical protein Scaly_1648700 [Sesamum calycinum]|uniref:Retrovirus-related Pol polyprotein from transposon TNT 1-94-like beta-barrel domain-containing protein n=1 Tax=Sesamum calycinum TaxID=2727403 RepID=A0AAW2PBQ5_9LAMI
MDVNQNGFGPSKPSNHSNVLTKLPLPNCGLTSCGTIGIEESCTIVVNKEACPLLSSLTSHGGRRLRCNLVDGLGLKSSNMIRLESSGSCEEVKQKILEISCNENGIGKMCKNSLTLIMETNKFNGTNYNDWLRKLRIVLDFENQGYVLDKPLPTALPNGSLPEERITFKKWLEDNRKVRSIILAPMTNDIQKQYDRLDDVLSIMLRMKEVYAVPDKHIKYVVTKALFGTKMTEGSSVQSHGVKMLSLVENSKTSKLGLIMTRNDPQVCASGIGRRSFNLQGERQEGRTLENGIRAKVMERSRRLSKNEMILRLGDGKAVAAEAVGSLSLVISDHIRIELKDFYYVPSMIKNINSIPVLDNNGYAFKIDRNSFYLMIDNNSHLHGYYFYDSSEQKIFVSKNAICLEKGFVVDSRQDEVLLEESSEAPQQNDITSFEPSVPTNGVPVLRRSTRESRPAKRYRSVGLTSQLDNDPKTYGEPISDIDSDK